MPGYYGYGYREPPSVIDDNGGPPPPGYRRDTQIRKGLVIGGATTFGALWLVTIVAGAGLADDVNSYSREQTEDYVPLFVPLVGPFIAIGTLNAEGVGTALLMIDGLAQTAGLAMLIAGVAAKKDVFVRDFSMGGHKVTVEAQPLVGYNAGGLSLTGTF
jgi:hypothetical protein